MTAPSIRSSSTSTRPTNSATDNTTAPGTIVAGDLLILAVGKDAAAVSLTPPTGFTTVPGTTANYDDGGTVSSVWSKTATGSEPALYTSTSSAGERFSGYVAAIQGVDSIHQVAEATQDPGDGTVEAATVTTTVADCLILYVIVTDDTAGTNTITAATGTTKDLEVSQNSGAYVGVFYEVKATPGTTTARTFTMNTTQEWSCRTIALAPPASGTSYNDTPDTTGTATTTAADTAQRADSSSTTGTATTTAGDVLAHAETVATTVSATTAVTDSMGGGGGFAVGATTTFASVGAGSQDNFDLPIPAHAVGDTLVASISLDNSGAVVNLPAGWSSPAATNGGSGGNAARLIYRVVDGSEGWNTAGGSVQNVTFNGFFVVTAVCQAMRGADTTAPVDAFGEDAALGGTPTAPDVTAVAGARRLLFGNYNITGTGDTITGYTKTGDISGSSSTRTECAAWAKDTDETGGATGAQANGNGAFTYWVSYTVTLKPAAAGGLSDTAATTGTVTTTAADAAQLADSSSTTSTATTTAVDTAQAVATAVTTIAATTAVADSPAAVDSPATTATATTTALDTLTHAETVATTIGATTAAGDNLAGAETVATTINATTTASDGTPYTDAADTTATAATTALDTLAHAETVATTATATTTAVDGAQRADTSSTTGTTTTTAADAAAFTDGASTTATGSTSSDGPVAGADTASTTVTATTTVLDQLSGAPVSYSDGPSTNVAATTAALDVAAFTGSSATTGTATTTVADGRGMLEAPATVATLSTTVLGLQAMLELVVTTVLGISAVSDSLFQPGAVTFVIGTARPFDRWTVEALKQAWSTGPVGDAVVATHPV